MGVGRGGFGNAAAVPRNGDGMTSRVQGQRFSVTATQPPNFSRPPGELWLNFPDMRLGMIDAGQASADLLAVRNYAPTASYAIGDHAVYSGQLQRATVAITPHAYTASEWDPLVTQSYTEGRYTTVAQNDGRYLLLFGGTMLGGLTLAGDPTSALQAATKQYVDTNDALKLNLSGGTLTGPLVLAAAPTSAMQAANKGYVDVALGGYLPLTGGTLSGTLVVGNGRLLSRNAANNPSVTVWDTNQGYAAGMFLGGSATLYFGGMDGAGNFTSTWARFTSDGNFWVNGATTAGYLHSTGSLDVDGNMAANVVISR